MYKDIERKKGSRKQHERNTNKVKENWPRKFASCLLQQLLMSLMLINVIFLLLLLLLLQCVVVTDCWQLFSHRKNLLSHKQHTKFILFCNVAVVVVVVVVAVDILNILPQGP